jgi:hypothetical protein
MNYATEKDAYAHLEQLLTPYFALRSQVPCFYGDQRLRIDYTATPKDPSFPFQQEFGIEVKSGDYTEFNNYTAGLRQAINYAGSEVDGRPLGLAFLFPGVTDGINNFDPRSGMFGGANRLAGKFGVGQIVVDARWGAPMPRFEINGGRLWDPCNGSVRNIPKWTVLGSGTKKPLKKETEVQSA